MQSVRKVEMQRAATAAVMIAGLTAPVVAQQPAELKTAPERTDYRETTRYVHVVAFMEAAAAASPRIFLDTLGYTFEGRALPVAVVGDIADGSPEAVLASGRTRVYIQGNIHAGEVEGKESALMLLREIAGGGHADWLDSLVLLIAPIYNADGNERINLTNRGPQHGPVGGMGTRANAQGLNLNRDHTKLDSPEARSLVQFLSRYDPHVIIDLHTTNGTRHGYYLTYAAPMHPNTDSAVVKLLREQWLPEVTRAVRDKYDWDFYYYGNVQGENESRGWYTFDYRAMFNNNYAGLRNRFGILSEAYSYATFEDRITATSRFLDEVLSFASRNAAGIRDATSAADAAPIAGLPLAVRAELERAGPVSILMGDVIEERNPYSGARMLRRADVRRPERMYEYGSFRPSETEIAPTAYLVPANLGEVISKLEAHGVRFERLQREAPMEVERFRIDSTTVSSREFEGHNQREVFGAWESSADAVPAGTIAVSLEQPLGRLVFSLLEPRSQDGFLSWNVLDEEIEGARYYPIRRVPDGND